MRLKQALGYKGLHGVSRPPSFLLSWSDNVPNEVSIDDDSFGIYSNASNMLLPNTDIVSLDSAFSVGVFLWCMLYYIVLRGPVLLALSKVMRFEESSFFADFKDKYAYDVPFDVEVARVLVIGLLATATTSATTVAFEGDMYWGWSIAGSLLIPSVLFYLAEEKRPTRTEGEQLQGLFDDFAMFKDENIVRKKGSTMDIERVVMSFRRRNAKYRDEAVVTDKAIKKVIRRILGGKGVDGVYADMELLSRMRESKQQLAENIARAKASAALPVEQAAEELPETDGTEFIR